MLIQYAFFSLKKCILFFSLKQNMGKNVDETIVNDTIQNKYYGENAIKIGFKVIKHFDTNAAHNKKQSADKNGEKVKKNK